MTVSKSKTIDWPQRQWATREFQRFCGRFELDEHSGLYFDCETVQNHKALISKTFPHLPTSVRQAALYLALTVSTTQNAHTINGDQSAVYGAWERDHAHISPHLEMSAASLNSELILPHLIHECCHLFWVIQDKDARQRYTNEMIRLVSDDFVDVTLYAQRWLLDWKRQPDTTDGATQERRRRALNKWVTESFCESVSRLCCPWYKSDERLDASGLLERRHQAISNNFGLSIARQIA